MKLRITLVATLVVVALLFWCYQRDQQLHAKAEEREAYFLSVYSVTMEAMMEEPVENFNELARHPNAAAFMPTLLRPFPQGLELQRHGDDWILAEPTPRKVSLFRQDRLVGSVKDFPHWERSGKRATKER